MSKRRATLFRRLRSKHRKQAMIVGVVGYTAETWAQVKATASDPQCFEDSFEQWQEIALATRREFLRSGVQALEYLIDPELFAAWCEQHQVANDAKARSEFVSEKLGERYAQSA